MTRADGQIQAQAELVLRQTWTLARLGLLRQVIRLKIRMDFDRL